jgi:ribosomal protein S18 acetylase RimI-like enzyme
LDSYEPNQIIIPSYPFLRMREYGVITPMMNLEFHSKDSLDIEELSVFTQRAYDILPVPFKYGTTLDEIRAFFRNDCPEFVAVAREGGELKGWAGVYHWTKSMDYLLSWHPLVVPPNPGISQRLVRECIKHTVSSGRDRIEVLLMNLTDDYKGHAAERAEIYHAAGMKRGQEWTFMEADLTSLDSVVRGIPDRMHARSLVEISNDELWPSYDHAFSNGGDRRNENQTKEQRRENFDTFFSRKALFDADASLVLFDGETIIAFIKIDITKEGTYVHGVGVIPEYRKQGIGKFVLATSLRRASENNHKKMMLEVDIENQAAVELYKSVGFKTVKGSVSYIWAKETGDT